MNTLMIKKIILLQCLLFNLAFSQGTNSFNFLQMNIGSRAQGMGNAFTAIPGDVNSIYFNPANVAQAIRPNGYVFSWSIV